MSTNRRPDRLKVVSHYPGRLRVRAESFRVFPDLAAEIAQRVREQAGVEAAETSARTGSLLVLYAPRVLQLPRLIELLVGLAGLHGLEIHPNDRAALVRTDAGVQVRVEAGALNAHVRRTTDDAIDLRVAVPGTLTALGIVRMVFGGVRVPEWYDFLFWSFVTFMQLNPPKDATIPQDVH